MKMNKIIKIEELKNVEFAPQGQLNGSGNQRLGIGGMLNELCGYYIYDGYKITTQENDYLLLIGNGQNCCENWGYFSTNDELNDFVGSHLIDVKLTDVALKTNKLVEQGLMYDDKISVDAGRIQFVDFETDNGVLQIAVYNSHNGYYGHSVLFAKDNQIILKDVF